MELQNDENLLIETVDAIADLKIEIWTSDFQHTLEGHPGVTIDKIRDALRNPNEVVQSKKSNRTCLFYSIGVEDEEFGMIYFCVVVGVIASGKGKLETAYEANYIKDGKFLFKRGDSKC